MEQEPPSFSLKQLVRQRFIKTLTGIMTKASVKELVLVLDNYTTNLISNIFVLSELVGLGVTMLERLDLKRKPLQMHVLYFI